MRKSDLQVGDKVKVKMYRYSTTGSELVRWMLGSVVRFGRTLVHVRVTNLKQTYPFSLRDIRWPS